MKKLHVVLAFAGAVAGVAHAQSAITTYGVVDMGYVREMGEVPGLLNNSNTQIRPTGNRVTSGAQSGTRLGFKGTEDLGNNLKALFVLETGIAADAGGFNQGGLAFGRQSFVGLQSNWGTLTLGRQYTSYFLTLNQTADPFASGLAGNAQNLMLPGAAADGDRALRMNNAVKYASPTFYNFSGEIAYGFGEVAGNNDANRVITGSFGYTMKPVDIRIAHYNRNNATDTESVRSTMLAANWDFDIAKLFIAAANNHWLGAKSRDYLIGATMPYGSHTFVISYIKKDGRGANAANDADQIGLGYLYALSKRTNLYAAYGSIDNDGTAAYAVGNNSETGSGNKAFNLGVRHLF